VVGACNPTDAAPLRTSDFDFDLPPELIAQHPTPRRDASRLLVLERPGARLQHRAFADLPSFIRPGDLLVFNQSKVLPARLRGAKARTGGRFEILLTEQLAPNDWWVMLRPGKRAHAGTIIQLLDRHGQPTPITATLVAKNDEGHCLLRFSGTTNLTEALGDIGETPLPPYINRTPDDPAIAPDSDRYQTVYARNPGSVAAPTAGLHFTLELLDRLRNAGATLAFVTLHVGLGTFAPVKADNPADHRMHEEWYELPAQAAEAICTARAQGHRVWTIGTTSLRALESVAADHGGNIVPATGRTRLFLRPPARFRVADVLLTNFHLPRSTLLMLVSAFASPGETRGRDLVLAAYAEAVRQRYRFFSYGDAMLILTPPVALP
jgi:S-adenosylmethionine:tRNA ribosyltransferase-isomerase